MTKNPAKRKRRFYFLLILAFTISLSIFFANKWVKTKGYSNLWDFITTTGGNYKSSWTAEYKTLQIYIDSKDFAKLEAQRNRALERGIMINEEDSYVPVVIVNDDKKAKGEIRLKGHMTDHLQKNKWSFRVKTKKNDAVMGMKRFSLQHPGTRNYIYEWIYHQMTASENIVSLRYDFVRVMVNDEDWGVYALEEHFGKELIQTNNRLSGPIIRFNPELYWVYRINELNGVQIDEAYAEMQSAYIEPYDTKNTLNDKDLKTLFENAMQRLEAFRRGELSTSQVFDVKKLASFHAIIDLVGGHHSLDWSDVKYYYNSQTQLLEPVSYESFSIRETKSICGSYKFTGDRSKTIMNLHDAIFNDTLFYSEYIAALERIADKKWLDQLLKSIDPMLNSHLKVLYSEFPYKNYSSKAYYKNIENITKLLAAPISFHAHLEEIKEDSIYLSIAGLDAFPAKIESLELDSFKVVLHQPIYIASKQQRQSLKYHKVAFALPENCKLDEKSKINLNYRIPGSKVAHVQKVFNYASYDESKIDQAYMTQLPNVNEFKFLVVDESSKTIRTLAGSHVIEKDLILPAGYKWMIHSGVNFDLKNKSKIISHASIACKGEEESPIVFTSSDESGQGIIINQTSGINEFSFTIIKNMGHPESGDFEHKAALNCYKSSLGINNCEFYSIKGSAIQVSNSNVRVNQLILTDISKDGFRSYFSNLEIDNCFITKVEDDAMILTGSSGRINSMEIKKCVSKGLWVKEYSNIRIQNIKISDCETGITVQDGSELIINSAKIKDCQVAFKVFKKGDVFGIAKVIVKQLNKSNCAKEDEVEKGSSLKIESES